MESEACSDSGPIIHLDEIKKLSLLNIFSKVIISTIIREELLKYNIENLPENISINSINKDQIILLSEKYSLDIGESSVILLCKALKISLMLTDDLDARGAAKQLDLEPVGTIGIVLRCFREDILNKVEAIKIVKDIYDNSSLFITSDLISYVIKEINGYEKKDKT